MVPLLVFIFVQRNGFQLKHYDILSKNLSDASGLAEITTVDFVNSQVEFFEELITKSDDFTRVFK